MDDAVVWGMSNVLAAGRAVNVEQSKVKWLSFVCDLCEYSSAILRLNVRGTSGQQALSIFLLQAGNAGAIPGNLIMINPPMSEKLVTSALQWITDND
jgi:hypothetical protein